MSEFAKRWPEKDGHYVDVPDFPMDLFFESNPSSSSFKKLQDLPLTPFARIQKLIRGNRCVQYGYGAFGQMASKMFTELEIFRNVVAIYDKDESIRGRQVGNLTVEKPPNEINGFPEFEYVIVCVANSRYLPEIVNYFDGLGIRRNRLLLLYYTDVQTQYFDNDIIVPRLVKGEVFIDAGCLDFTTSKRLLELNSDVKKIYAFEPDGKNIEIVKRAVAETGFQNAAIRRYAWWSADTTLLWSSNGGSSQISANGSETVEVRAVDSVIPPDEIVTYIKMDIEGAELEALKGARDTIIRCKPKLAICIYHKPYDYLEILEYIYSLNPGYKAFIRQYFTYNITESVAYFV
jgi:FkbM family methyltransferase